MGRLILFNKPFQVMCQFTDDSGRATLMKSFYKNLTQGLAKDEALRRAKLELIKGQKQAWQHPTTGRHLF